MKIWTANNLPEHGKTPSLDFGVWSDGESSAEILQTFRTGEPVPAAGTCLLAPGQSLAPDLLSALRDGDRDIYAPVNGLAEEGMAMLRDSIGPGRLILTFDFAAGAVDLAYFEQLAWLSHQPERFAVMTDLADAMLPAALAGAAAILIEDAAGIDFSALDRVAAQRLSERARPIAPAETEALAGREACLTVSRPLRAGEIIDTGDLAVTVTEYRGLSPALKDAVAGRTLRYDIAPGEALHFGHIL